MADVVRVVVTGGAGQIAYSLIPHICKGLIFGPSTMVDLRLLDIEPAKDALKGVVMEIQDSAYDLMASVMATTDVAQAFKDVQVAVLLGGFPRKQGMERQDLIEKNVQIMRLHGQALEQHADRNCKVVVVANPANTNCLVAMKYAPSISPANFSALTRLDHDRLRGMLAAKVTEKSHHKISAKDIRNCVIWGNHSSSQVPDATHAEALVEGKWQAIAPLCNDPQWLEKELVPAVQNRGAAVIAARKLSSALSAANAVACHLRDWVGVTSSSTTGDGMFVSMAVISDGNPYGIPEGLVFSFPVASSNGKCEIVQGLSISTHVRELLDATVAELLAEREMATSIIAARQGAL
ncbi:malate dehydrogenase [Tribonema minus]|uniref:malate dehydrogenase n=1 Tax=Tribonema minus TaxID=303371 RepID=A0A835YXR8_9STRA|nr:malate dehydrogenase [Tribonema minus]|eukprot:TRINITY_DN9053_c0_g1_i1.p1 TRINITY_DN9053_c0_g1~~TRINITY_DN9053_c0_g1_i1.p1  ORF type:complete len:379 (+),score=89.82 TRINITY_DN9053_c0_g1_i1:89-1138(+)